MERTVEIGGKEYRMRATALTPKLYRHRFGRDMIRDMSGLIKAYNERQGSENNEESDLKVLDHLEVFENIAWLFMKDAGEEVGENPDEWLDSLDGIFSVYEAMPAIIELWFGNQKTTSTPKNPEGLR